MTLNKALTDLEYHYELSVKTIATRDGQIAEQRAQIEQGVSDCEVYQQQLNNLKTFIDELEENNKGLMKFLDKKQFEEAHDYKEKVYELLSRGRASAGASLRQPSPGNQSRGIPVINSTAKSFSPLRRGTGGADTITPIGFENNTFLNTRAPAEEERPRTYA